MGSSELDFTGANAMCAHPEYWHSEDEQATEREVIELVAALVRALQPELVVETGTYRGFMARAIGRALRENKHGRLVSLEVDEALVIEASERCDGLPVEVVNLNSLDYMPPEPVGFAWFDSLPEIRTQEYLRYQPMLQRIVGFHDTGPQHCVRESIEVLEKQGHIRPIYLPTPRGCCLAEVLRR